MNIFLRKIKLFPTNILTAFAWGEYTDKLAPKIGGGMEMSVGLYMSLVIKAWLSIQGLIFLGLLLFAGFEWMTAEKAEAVKTAGTRIKNATIGLALTAAAYAITQFVFKMLDAM